MPLFSLKYKDVHGVDKYYMDIGFESREAAEREKKKLYVTRKNYQLKGLTLGSFLNSGQRIPLSFYDFTVVERKLKL